MSAAYFFCHVSLCIELQVYVEDAESLPMPTGVITIYNNRGIIVASKEASMESPMYPRRFDLNAGVYRIEYKAGGQIEYSMDHVYVSTRSERMVTIRPIPGYPAWKDTWSLSKRKIGRSRLRGEVFFRKKGARVSPLVAERPAARFVGSGVSILSRDADCSSTKNRCRFENSVIVDCGGFEWAGTRAVLDHDRVVVFSGSKEIGFASISESGLACRSG